MSTYVLGAGTFATQFATKSPSVPVPVRLTPAVVNAAAAAAVTPSTPVRGIAIKVASPVLQRAIDKAIAARAAQTEVRTGVPVTLKSSLMNAAVQKALTARSMRSIAPAAPSVLEQTGLNPPVAAAPTVTPSSPYSFVPEASGGGGGSSQAVTAAPDVAADTTDQMSQVDTAAAAGDLSEQELATIKADLASKPAAIVPSAGPGWIPIVILIGLVGIAVSQSRRTGGRIGRRGWGD